MYERPVVELSFTVAVAFDQPIVSGFEEAVVVASDPPVTLELLKYHGQRSGDTPSPPGGSGEERKLYCRIAVSKFTRVLCTIPQRVWYVASHTASDLFDLLRSEHPVGVRAPEAVRYNFSAAVFHFFFIC